MRSTVVVRIEVPVLFVAAIGGPGGAAVAFARLEAALGGPRGRRFFGWVKDGEYRACALRRESDDASALGLCEGILPGGTFARIRHDGPPDRLSEAFVALGRSHQPDGSRASLEEYRREGEVYALLPIRG